MDWKVLNDGWIMGFDIYVRVVLGWFGVIVVLDKWEGDGGILIGCYLIWCVFYRVDCGVVFQIVLLLWVFWEDDGWCDVLDDSVYNCFVRWLFIVLYEVMW